MLTFPRFTLAKANAIIRSKFPASTSNAGNAARQPIRIYAQTQPIHPLAHLRQSRSQHRWFSKSTRNLSSSARPAGPYNRASFPVSKTSKAIARSRAAPFASTLRPNLTGGALPRTAGGYCLGGSGRQGVRHFSHTPSAQAQVVQSVGAGIRAFVVGGGKARYDGIDPRTGAKKYKAVTKTQDQVLEKLSNPAPCLGSALEFRVSPIITALGPSFSSSASTLNTSGLLDTLATDFARALRDLSLILTDLRRLATLGDLPLTLTHNPTGPVLVVRFPGCDARIVESLCDEVGVRRGVVREDEGWRGDKAVEMALLFPFASTADAMSDARGAYFEQAAPKREPEKLDWRHMLSPSNHPSATAPSELSSVTPTFTELVNQDPVLTPLGSPEGYESLRDSDFGSEDPRLGDYDCRAEGARERCGSGRGGSEEFEGLEGIYRFLRECEHARR